MQVLCPLIRVLGVNLPLSSAAVAVTTLNVEPGAYRPCVPRLSRGAPLLGLFSLATCRATVLGLWPGVEAIASTRPVLGSIATTAPEWPVRPCIAARWAGTDRVVAPVLPLTAAARRFLP